MNLRKYIFLSLICLIGSSCGSAYEKPYIHPDFIDIVINFEQINNQKVESEIDYVEEFDSPHVVGVCYYPRKIRIKRKYYAEANEDEREALLYHELGHCELGRGHKLDVDVDTKTPESLMYPTVLPSYIYGPRKTYYLRELVYENYQ